MLEFEWARHWMFLASPFPGSFVSSNTSTFLDNTVNICLSYVKFKSEYSYSSPPLRFACYPCQHTPGTVSTNGPQSVTFGSQSCNCAVNINENCHKLSSLIDVKVWIVLWWFIQYTHIRSTIENKLDSLNICHDLACNELMILSLKNWNILMVRFISPIIGVSASIVNIENNPMQKIVMTFGQVWEAIYLIS